VYAGLLFSPSAAILSRLYAVIDSTVLSRYTFQTFTTSARGSTPLSVYPVNRDKLKGSESLCARDDARKISYD